MANLSTKCRAVANYIIEQINKYNEGKNPKEQVLMSTKRLQKLLYFCEVEYMIKNNGEPLFTDEFYALPSGPFIESVVPEYIKCKDGRIPIKNEVSLPEDIKIIIDQILELTKELDTSDLIKITNVPGGPHSKVYKEEGRDHKQIVSKEDTYLYYSKYNLISQLKQGEPILKSLHQDEILKLEDKDEQLRYILGGLYPHGRLDCDSFWGCDIRCSTLPVPKDEKYKKTMDFITNHNISNATFLRLARTYLFGSFNSFKGDWGILIPELDRAIMDYNFVHTDYESIPENDLKERELLELVEREADVEGTSLNNFLTKYSLTPVDFIILAKTSINYQFKIARGFEKTDLISDLQGILMNNDLYQSYEWVKMYRDNLQKQNSQEEKPKSLIKRIKNKLRI